VRLGRYTERKTKFWGPREGLVTTRVARCFVFKPKIQLWKNFGGSCNGRCWHILLTLRPFYGLLLYFMDIRYICDNLVYFSRFGILFQEKSGNPGDDRLQKKSALSCSVDKTVC
jgi:hypothetical protein